MVNKKEKRGIGRFMITYLLGIIILLIILTQTGCTNKYTLKEMNNLTNTCNNRITQLKQTINKTNQTLKTCQNTPPTQNNTIKYIQNSTLGTKEKQKYSIEITWLRKQLEILNKTDGYLQLQRNYTNIQYEYEKCNNTLQGILATTEKWNK